MSSSATLQDIMVGLGQIPGAMQDTPAQPRDPQRPDIPPWYDRQTPAVQISGTFPVDFNGIPQVGPAYFGGDAEELFEPVGPEGEQGPLEPPRDWTESGTELLAWYSPFHACQWDWGVHIRAYGIEVVAGALRSAGTPKAVAASLGYRFLLGHELGHFHAELLVSAIELATRQSLFLQGRIRQSQVSPGWGLAEEGLCNALGRQRLPRSDRLGLNHLLASSPVGYRDFKRHTLSTRSLSWAEAVDDIVGGNPTRWHGIPGKPDLTDAVPVVLHLDGSGPGGGPANYLLRLPTSPPTHP
jgi:hypothetical protein